MPTRSAISPFHKLIITAGLLLLPFLAHAESEQRLTLEEGRQLALQALQADQPELTLQVARGLLQANPRDAGVYYLVANAHARRGNPYLGRRAAAKAYRFSENSDAKFQAAQLAAQLSYRENRHTLSQIWLRRTAIHAPNEEIEERVAQDYRLVRAQNPWFFRFRGDLKPSNNVNNGSDTALQIIDGVPVAGTLNGAAQALSGLITTADIITTYRLRGDQRSATTLGGRLYVQRVALSSDAQAQAPWLRNSDFDSTYAEVSLRHAFAIGELDSGDSGFVDLAYGTSWYGGYRSYDFVRLSGERRWRLRGGQILRVDALIENRHNARFLTNDAEIYGVGARFTQPLKNGDQVHLVLALRDTNAQRANGTYQAASLRTAYEFGRSIGPMRVGAGLVLGYADYPVFRSGLFFVPGGRQDRSIYGDVSMLFDQYDYAGFAPMLRLRAGRKSSNDSRYDIQEFSVSLGIESKF